MPKGTNDPELYDQCWVLADGTFSTAAGPNMLQFDGRKFLLPPGQRVTVPRGCVDLWLGNPDARDHPTDESKNYRAQELARVSRKWGVVLGQKATFPTTIHAWSWEGDLFITCVEDPTGRTLAGPDQNQITQEMLVEQQKLIQKQMQMLRQVAAENEIDLDEMSLEPPDPTKFPDAPPPAPEHPFDPPAATTAEHPTGPAITDLPEPVDPMAKASTKKSPAKAKPATPVAP